MSSEDAEKRWKYMVFNKDITEEESLNFYSTWAQFYDSDQQLLGFKRQFQLAEKLASFYPDLSERKSIQILDIAAGTGLVGIGLKQEGFGIMDAVDGNQAMLDKLKAKNVYRNSYLAILGNKDQPIHKDIKDGSYDVALIMGGFAQSHLPVESLYQAVRALKPNGLFINLMTKKYLSVVTELSKLEPLMDRMEQLGIWTKVEVFVDSEEKQGIYHIYRKK